MLTVLLSLLNMKISLFFTLLVPPLGIYPMLVDGTSLTIWLLLVLVRLLPNEMGRLQLLIMGGSGLA